MLWSPAHDSTSRASTYGNGSRLLGWLFGEFAANPLPTHYLTRPAAVALLIAAGVTVVVLALPRLALPLSVSVSVLIVSPTYGMATMSGLVILLALQRVWGLQIDVSIPVGLAVAMFLMLGTVQVVPLLEHSSSRAHDDARGRPIYLILLDGYGRVDELAERGIDNGQFVRELEDRGFDHYPEAESRTRWTELTLHELLTGGQDDAPGDVERRRERRAEWELPNGFVAISPPIGHVTLPGPSIDSGGMNDFEAHLLGASVFAPVAEGFVIRGLRERADEAFGLLATTQHRRVFAHVLPPHPPFLWGVDEAETAMTECWPEHCHAFENSHQGLGIASQEWLEGMRWQLAAVNKRVLAAVDAIIDRHPEAVIVVFGDHGFRHSTTDLDEWTRPFLAARTPGKPNVFASDPRPGAILKAIYDAYPDTRLFERPQHRSRSPGS